MERRPWFVNTDEVSRPPEGGRAAVTDQATRLSLHWRAHGSAAPTIAEVRRTTSVVLQYWIYVRLYKEKHDC